MAGVLLVDGDRAFVASITPQVSGLGHKTFAAESADAAIEVMLNQRVDVLLTDLQLGQTDGLALIRMAKEVSPTTRALLMSANASARDYKAAMELGAVDVLSKPFTAEDLAQSIQKAIECEVGFRGSIHGLALSDILQMFHFARRSLVIQLGSDRSVIHMENGEIVHAAAGDQRGPRALSLLLEHRAGSVRTLPPSPCERTVNASFEGLLLDATREMDERKRTTSPSRAVSATDELQLDGLDREAPPPPPPRASQVVPALPTLAEGGPPWSGAAQGNAAQGQSGSAPSHTAAARGRGGRGVRPAWTWGAAVAVATVIAIVWLWPRRAAPPTDFDPSARRTGVATGRGAPTTSRTSAAPSATTGEGASESGLGGTRQGSALRPQADETVTVTLRTLPTGLLLIDAVTGQELGLSPITTRRAPGSRLTQVKASLGDRESPALGVAPDRDVVELDFRPWLGDGQAEPVRLRPSRERLAPAGRRAVRAAGPAIEPSPSPKAAPVPAAPRPRVEAVGEGGRPAVAPLMDSKTARPSIGVLR